MAKKVQGGKPYKGPAVSPHAKPKPVMQTEEGDMRLIDSLKAKRPRKPKGPKVHIKIEASGSVCVQPAQAATMTQEAVPETDPCTACMVNGDIGADYCEVGYAQDKAQAIIRAEGMKLKGRSPLQLVRVRTERVRTGRTAPARPWVDTTSTAPRRVHLRRVFIFQ